MLYIIAKLIFHGCHIIQIMNFYECNGSNIFMRWKIKCSIQWGKAKLNGTFHLSPKENICSIAWMENIHYLKCNLYKDSYIILNKFTRKKYWIWKRLQLKQNLTQAARPTLHNKCYTGICVMLSTCTAFPTLSPRRVLHLIFFISFILPKIVLEKLKTLM